MRFPSICCCDPYFYFYFYTSNPYFFFIFDLTFWFDVFTKMRRKTLFLFSNSRQSRLERSDRFFRFFCTKFRANRKTGRGFFAACFAGDPSVLKVTLKRHMLTYITKYVHVTYMYMYHIHTYMWYVLFGGLHFFLHCEPGSLYTWPRARFFSSTCWKHWYCCTTNTCLTMLVRSLDKIVCSILSH